MPIGTALVADPHNVEGITSSQLSSMSRGLYFGEASAPALYDPRLVIKMFDDDASFDDWSQIDK